VIFKKALVWVGSLLILGMAFTFAADNPQAQARNAVKERVKSKFQVGPLFVDQDGDGICDFARDHDNDGIPNSQDPDWSRPQDGTGYKNRNGDSSGNNFNYQKGYRGGNAWNKRSFRQNKSGPGNGLCDGTGPKANAYRGGKH
jgi:hypothetical protein